jgi:hypothetical protein
VLTPCQLRVVLISLSLVAGACGAGDEFSATPSRGATRGGDTLRIHGQGFASHGPPVVHVGNNHGLAVVVESDRLITLKTPAADPGTVSIQLQFGDGTAMELADAFEYEDRPNVLLAQ